MSTFREKISEENGYALVMTVLGFSVLLAFTGLAVDSGMLFQAKRKMQTAADAAAVAGTLDYLYNHSVSSAKNAAWDASKTNSYEDGANGVHVYPSNPPADGPNSGSDMFTEVVVTQDVPTLFMRVFGVNTVNIGARAVAGTPAAGDACIWVMGTSGTTMDLQGKYAIQAPGCGIYVNSPDASAIAVGGNGGTVNAEFLDVVGSSTSVHATTPTPVSPHAMPRSNPWGNFNGDSPSGCDTTTTTLSGTIAGPGPGKVQCYANAITISNNTTIGSGTMGTDSNGKPTMTVTTDAGTLLFKNGVTLGGKVNIYGGTLEIYGGTFNQSNYLLNISAPTTGSYAGIALMMPTNNTTGTCKDPHTTTPCLQTQFGSSNQFLGGYIYAPGAEVYMQDNGGGTTAAGLVCSKMYEKASKLTITTNYDKLHPGVTPNRVITLVE